MAEPPVVNSSPLIVMARAGVVELLRSEGEYVIVPRVVAGEIGRRGPDDPAVRALRTLARLVVVDTRDSDARVAACGIDAGEAAVLRWAARHPGTTVIVDDARGRRCAEQLGIPVRGTLGLILTAKRDGRIPGGAAGTRYHPARRSLPLRRGRAPRSMGRIAYIRRAMGAGDGGRRRPRRQHLHG